MKEITRKSKLNSIRFLQSINVHGKKNSHIAEGFNKYFINAGPNLTSKMQNTFSIPVQKNMELGTSLLRNLKKLLSQ